MAVEIESVQFTDEYSGSGATKNDFIMGSFFDKLTAYVTVSVHWETLQIQARFNSTNKTIERTDNYSFIRDGFKKGDTFNVSGTTAGINDGDYTIDTITDSTITTIEAIASTGIYSLVDLHGTTQVNSIDFYYNLIENSAPLSFVSLTDNQSVQRVNASKTNWVSTETVTFVQATPSIGWQTAPYGTAEKTTDSNLASDWKQTFVITHVFFIAPFYLSGDLVYSEGKFIYPPYFSDTNSLKYIARVDAKYDTVNPSIPHTTDPDYEYQYGNIGWFGEFLNGQTPDYSLTSVTYTDSITSASVDGVQIDRVTNVAAVIASAAGRFTGVPQQVLNFIYCPQDPQDYISTATTTLLNNFRLDHKLITPGGAPVNGANYGTDYQAFKNITSTINSVNQLTINFQIDLSSATQTYLLDRDANNRKLMLVVTPQKEASTMLADTDRNIVLIDFSDAIIDLDDSTILTWQDTGFHNYPETTTNSYTDIKGFIGDHYLARAKFHVSADSTPKDITVQIVAYNSVTGDSFDLEKYTQTFPESELQGLVCESNQPVILNYKLTQDDIYNQAYLYRNTFLDTATDYGYQFDYGFVARYETWRDVPEFDSAFSCDHSQDWSIYSLVPDWSLKFIITVNVEKNDNVTEFKRYHDMSIMDDTFSDDGFGGILVPSIQTFYDNLGTLTDAKGLIFTDQNTHVKLTFTGDFSALPASAVDYFGYLALDIKGEGGEFFREICTTEFAVQDSSPWIDRAFLTKVSNTELTIEGDLDYTKLDLTQKEYLLTGRLRYKY